MAPKCKSRPVQAGTEHQTTHKLKRSDARALENLFDRYGLTLYRFVLRIVRNPADAEDILQEVFARATLRAAGIREDEPRLGCWLLTVARNLAYDHLRSRGAALSRHVPLTDDYAQPGSGDGNLIANELQDRVARAVKRLRPRQKKVIELAYYCGLTQAQIAQATNQPLGTIKGRTRAAMLQLQTILESE